MQSTSGHLLPVIITLFSTVAFVAILVVIFGVIVRRRKESRKKRRQKNQMYEYEYKFDDGLQNYDHIINGDEVHTYEMLNYYEINQNESKIEANINKTVEYLEISELN